MSRALDVLAALATLACGLQAQNVWNVQPGPGNPLQQAIDQAADADTILVQAGTYPPSSLTGKSLHVLGEGDARIDGQLDLEPTTGQRAYVANLRATSFRTAGDPFQDPTTAEVFLEDCVADGMAASGIAGIYSNVTGLHVTGGSFTGADEYDYGWDGLSLVAPTQAFLHHTAFQGGVGLACCGQFGIFGPGVGGAGIRAAAGSEVLLGAVTALGGDGDDGSVFGYVGVPGLPLDGLGTFLTMQAPPGRLSVPNLAREGELIPMTIDGPPGSRVRLLYATQMASGSIDPVVGALEVANIIESNFTSIPPSGTRTLQWTVPNLQAESVVLFVQAVIAPPGAQRFLTNPSGLVLVDAAF